jgi:Putative Ig domain
MRNNKYGQVLNVLIRVVVWISAAASLAGCGGSGNSAPPPRQSASITYPSSSLTFVAGTTIPPVAPTASQGLSTFAVTPALPAGLSLSSSSGTISGTPTAASAAATYTVTASGGGATATTTVSITVNPAPPSSVSYGSPAFTFTLGIAARTLTPSASGGAATGWSIKPALPAGLKFDTSDGVISGTPSAAWASSSYVVTAQNSGGNATVTLTIEVDGGPLLDLGHGTSLTMLQMSGASVLSLDQSGHWVLWNYSTAAGIASGDLYCAPTCNQLTMPSHLADMAGGTVVLATQNGFEFLSATSGQVTANVTASVSWWSLASDGSYLAAGSSSGLFAWSPSGIPLASLSGDFSKATAFADSGEIQVAGGPSGENVIQTVAVPGGASANGAAFNGQFTSWFTDGSHFITTAGTTTLVYSQGSVQQAAITPTYTAQVVAGEGNWVWTVRGQELDVYAIAAPSAPAASFIIEGAPVIPSGSSLAVSSARGVLSVIDLSGTTPAETDYSLPVAFTIPSEGDTLGIMYTATSTSQWMLGNGSVLLDGGSLSSTPRYFDYGAVTGIAGSSGSIAVATQSGRILYFNASTLTQEGEIDFPANRVLLSSDGSVLAASDNTYPVLYDIDSDVSTYSLPGEGLLNSWPYSLSGSVPGQLSGTGLGDISLSGSGAALGQVFATESSGATTSCTLEVTPTAGGSATSSMTSNACVVLFMSPDGTLIAATTGLGNSSTDPNPGTNILQDGSLLTAITGMPAGWIDDGHLLVNTFADNAVGTVYAGCNVYSPSGQSTGPCALPEVTAFQTLTSGSIYAVYLGEILSVSTGTVSWTSGDSMSGIQAPITQGSLSQFAYSGSPTTGLPAGNPVSGAIAGNHLVFASGHYVLAQGY